MPDKYGTPSFDIIGDLQTQIRRLEDRLRRLENQKTSTVPYWHKSSLSNRDLLAGQVFIGRDNTLNYITGTVDQTTVYQLNGTIYTV